MPRILFVVPADYEALKAKGVDRMILERDEHGFFDRVVTVHPLASMDRTVDLNQVHRVREFSAGRCIDPPTIGGFVALPWRLAGIARRLVQIVREEHIDIIRATDAYVMGLLAWFVARRTGVPFCVSIHAPYEERFALAPRSGIRRVRRALASMIPPFVLRRADLVLPIRAHLAVNAIAAGASPAHVHVIPHGIDLAPFTALSANDIRADLDIAPDRPIISFVGRLAADNYIEDMLAVTDRIIRRRQDVVFVIAGDGELRSHVDAWRQADASRRAQVRVVGFWPYEKVMALRRSSVAALALMGGFSLIEACAAGCVPVAYDVEWHREIVLHEKTGFLARPGDVESVSMYLERLLDDRALAAALGAAARQLAFEHHDLRRTSQAKRDAYQWLIDGHRGAR